MNRREALAAIAGAALSVPSVLNPEVLAAPAPEMSPTMTKVLAAIHAKLPKYNIPGVNAASIMDLAKQVVEVIESRVQATIDKEIVGWEGPPNEPKPMYAFGPGTLKVMDDSVYTLTEENIKLCHEQTTDFVIDQLDPFFRHKLLVKEDLIQTKTTDYPG